MAAAHLGLFPSHADAASRELTAIGRGSEWLNSPRLTADDLSGKVVVVDFCTYTCINWLRTLPYVRAWSQKYRQGLVVIGVHTPEFDFEKNLDNVRRMIGQMNVPYPMVIDNDYAIWKAFDNQYWPALYFVDAKGHVRDHQFGEGEYARSEKTIQRLLRDASVTDVPEGVVEIVPQGIEAPANWATLASPESYVGYERGENFASRGGADRNRRRLYDVPTKLLLNQWALAGEWTIGRQATTLNGSGGRIAYRFRARDAHLVMGPSERGGQVRFRLTLDGHPPGQAHGLDVDENGNGIAADQRLYQLVRQRGPIVDRLLEIEFLDAGVDAFSFTFG